MLAIYSHTTTEPTSSDHREPGGTWAWDSGETTCDGCGHRIATRAARIVSYGPVNPGGTCDERPRVFHRLQCAQDDADFRTLTLGLRDL